MMSERFVYVEVWNSESLDRLKMSEVPDKAVDFCAWLTSKLETVPTEFQKDVMIDFSIESDYDRGYVNIEIYYHRPETPAEQKAREEREREIIGLCKV